MAISRFYSESDNAYGLFYDFLELNKEGSFLEGMTITSGEDGTEVTIAKDNVTISMSKQSTSTPFFSYTTDNVSVTKKGNAEENLQSALLCKNGLICGFLIRSSSNTGHTHYIVLITTDSTGGLAIITENNVATYTVNTSNDISSFCVCASSSITTSDVVLRPQYGSQLTSLAPTVPTTFDNSIILPNAYVAIHTQVGGVGLQAVTIDGENYITNGVWYIKD